MTTTRKRVRYCVICDRCGALETFRLRRDAVARGRSHMQHFQNLASAVGVMAGHICVVEDRRSA